MYMYTLCIYTCMYIHFMIPNTIDIITKYEHMTNSLKRARNSPVYSTRRSRKPYPVKMPHSELPSV